MSSGGILERDNKEDRSLEMTAPPSGEDNYVKYNSPFGDPHAHIAVYTLKALLVKATMHSVCGKYTVPSQLHISSVNACAENASLPRPRNVILVTGLNCILRWSFRSRFPDWIRRSEELRGRAWFKRSTHDVMMSLFSSPHTCVPFVCSTPLIFTICRPLLKLQCLISVDAEAKQRNPMIESMKKGSASSCRKIHGSTDLEPF